MRYLIFVLGFAIIVLVFIAGCSSGSEIQKIPPSLPPSTMIVSTTTVESPVTSPPSLTATPSLGRTNTLSTNVTTNTSSNAVRTIATPPPQSTLRAADDPFIDNFQLSKFAYGISDCIMQQAFPDIAKDPDYGIKSAHPKLVGISSEKWNAFYDDWKTGKNTGQSQTFSAIKCQNVPYSESNTWDMAFVEARFTARNAKTTDYAIIVSISANGKNVAQLITNETLSNQQELTIYSWIPVKRTEIGLLDNPSINFNKITNI